MENEFVVCATVIPLSCHFAGTYLYQFNEHIRKFA